MVSVNLIQWLKLLPPLAMLLCTVANLHAQQRKYSTIEQAAADPVVVRLLGQDKLDRLLATQMEKSANIGSYAQLAEGHRLAGELNSQVELMVENFVYHRWDEEFDAKEFVLAIEKLKRLRNGTSVPTVKQYIVGRFERLQYRLNLNTVMYGLSWNIKQLSGAPNGSQSAKKFVERDFMVVPYAAQEFLEPGNLEAYQNSHKLALQVAGIKSGGLLGGPSGFDTMSKQFKREAATWYATHQSTFEAGIQSSAIDFQQQFFNDNVQSMLFREASKKLIKVVSKAKSELNDANSGLKYAKINSDKAAESASKGDAANTKSYLDSAREHAIELSNATRRLSELQLEATALRQYMHGEAAVRTLMEDIGTIGIKELQSRHQNHPRGGNANTVARDTLLRMISTGEQVQQINGWLVEANSNCKQIDSAMVVGERALAKLSSKRASAGASPFDVSSREAFETSKEKLATAIPTKDYIAFSQAWVKLLQEAIKEDPMVMAEDPKYLKFLKENFEGKTVADIIGK